MPEERELKNIEGFLTLKIIIMIILKAGKSEPDLSCPCGEA